jgi:siroheme synthase-like protein
MTSLESSDFEGFPAFLRLAGLAVLVVGGGPIALEKARTLHAAGAQVRVVAPEISVELAALADACERRPFAARDVDGVWLAIAAATADVNREVKRAADLRRVFVIAVDDVASCSAFGAAELRRGGLTVAISSNGRAPALVALLRRALSELLGDEVEGWVVLAERARRRWKSEGVPIAQRQPLLLQALQALHATGGES